MIKSFRHKDLQKFYESGSKAGINPAHSNRLEDLLGSLNLAKTPQDMDDPGRFLHPLHGDPADHWSVRVSGNWRLTFRIANGDAEVVDYQDYH